MSPRLQKDNPLDDLISKWETELSIPPHCFLFDAALFKQCMVSFDETLATHEDWECWMNVLALNPAIAFIDRPLANYRMRTTSMCSNSAKMRDGYLEAIDKQIRKHASNSEIVARLKARKKQIRLLYRDVSPVVRTMAKVHPGLKNLYTRTIPWRIQRMLD